MSWFTDAVSAVGDTATSAYDGACGFGKDVTKYVHKAEDGLAGGMHTAEDWLSDNTHALADKVSDVPVLNVLAGGMADTVSMGGQIVGGIVEGAGSLVGGALNAVAHPLDTLKGLDAMQQHMPGPLGDISRLGHEAFNVIQGKEGVLDGLNKALNPLAHGEEDLKFWGHMGSAIIDPY